MSAVLKPEEDTSRTLNLASFPIRTRRVTPLPADALPSSTVSLTGRLRRPRPLWLKLLEAGQKLSLVVSVVTIAGALLAYSLTVNTNRRLSLATATLEQLQDQQQQLTTANAVFKNHLTETALTDQDSGKLHPKNVIFLEADDIPLEADDVSGDTDASQSVSAEARHSDQDRPRFFPKGY